MSLFEIPQPLRVEFDQIKKNRDPFINYFIEFKERFRYDAPYLPSSDSKGYILLLKGIEEIIFSYILLRRYRPGFVN